MTFTAVEKLSSAREQKLKTEKRDKWISGTVSEQGDRRSTVEEEEDLSREQLQMIKARTMFQMTDEILDDGGGVGRKRLLFLTNSQADLISSSSASLQKMLDALEVPRPKLVINLLMSQGLAEYIYREMPAEMENWGPEDAGLVTGRGPFLKADDERRLMDHLDHFMATVILPLAAQTNAIILCSALQGACMLSSSLTRMLAVHRSTWGREPPFTVISTTTPEIFYENPDESAVWRVWRRASRAWRQRDRKLLELVCAKYDQQVPICHSDLDPNSMIYLMVDTINPRKDRLGERGPYNKLINELLRYLAQTLPCLTIKTGHSDKPSLARASQHASGLGVAMEAMLSGSPLLFLDMRERPVLEAMDRSKLIEQAKVAYERNCTSLLEVGVAETFDTMAVAYFHDVLFGDGDVHSSAGRHQGGSKRQSVPLHEAIKRAEEGRGATHDGKLAPASVQQVHDTALWLANRFFADAWEVQPESVREAARANGASDFATYYGENITALAIHIRTIMSGRNFHHLNLHSVDTGASRLVGELVKLDRLPNETSLQGLLLLRGAWCEVDVAKLLAGRYKVLSKLVFLAQLCVAFALVIVALAVETTDSSCATNANETLASYKRDSWPALSHVLFGLATVIFIISVLDSILNAATRWHQLRSMACSLEAILWMYRARVGRFQQSISDSARPEIELLAAINAWRDELVSAADLQSTDLERLRAPTVYKHKQFEGERLLAEEDDHHSPIKPEAYLALRLHCMMHFYQRRLPVYTRLRFAMRLAVALCTAASAVLAHVELSRYVVGVTVFAGSLVSWSEFSETGRKIERYSRAIRSLKKLLSWWDVLTDVEKAGTDNISTLIESGESIISDERQAWQSTANRLAGAKKAVGQGELMPDETGHFGGGQSLPEPAGKTQGKTVGGGI